MVRGLAQGHLSETFSEEGDGNRTTHLPVSPTCGQCNQKKTYLKKIISVEPITIQNTIVE